jgi:hypothetical protein
MGDYNRLLRASSAAPGIPQKRERRAFVHHHRPVPHGNGVDARRLGRFEPPSDHSLAAGKRFGVTVDLSLDLTTSAFWSLSVQAVVRCPKGGLFQSGGKWWLGRPAYALFRVTRDPIGALNCGPKTSLNAARSGRISRPLRFSGRSSRLPASHPSGVLREETGVRQLLFDGALARSQLLDCRLLNATDGASAP